MTIEQLMKLQRPSEVPFNHKDYTVWLHNKIVEQVRNDIQDLYDWRQAESELSFKTLRIVKGLPSLKTI